ncbi:hypothetical protein [Staphylococcus coagulans]|uniref:hypothetical protein n=1 Tax=Staphylococcus coagulans TaxID=74706 RepID=UPI003D137E68
MTSLYDFMKEHSPEKVDSITDRDSVVKHFRTASKVYKEQRDSLITDVADLRNQRDKLQRKLDEVVSMVNAYITAERAYSGDGAQNLLENELNRILDGDLVSEQNKYNRLYSTEIEQTLKNKNLHECLFLLEKIQMDLEENE